MLFFINKKNNKKDGLNFFYFISEKKWKQLFFSKYNKIKKWKNNYLRFFHPFSRVPSSSHSRFFTNIRSS